jgi:hypothetical protein
MAISIVGRTNARLLNIAIPIAILAASLRRPILSRIPPQFAATKRCRSQAKSSGCAEALRFHAIRHTFAVRAMRPRRVAMPVELAQVDRVCRAAGRTAHPEYQCRAVTAAPIVGENSVGIRPAIHALHVSTRRTKPSMTYGLSARRATASLSAAAFRSLAIRRLLEPMIETISCLYGIGVGVPLSPGGRRGPWLSPPG